MQDDGEAQDMLSFMLLDGERIGQDLVEARRWAQAAADKGYSGAATRLGSIFYDAPGTQRGTGAALHLGQGAAANQEEAYRALLLAERRGSMVAMRYLPTVRERLAPEIVRRIEAAAQPTVLSGVSAIEKFAQVI